MPVNTKSGLQDAAISAKFVLCCTLQAGVTSIFGKQYMAPYLPDFTACALSLFLRMKSLLQRYRFQVVPKIKQRSLTVLHMILKSQVQQCLQQWLKCLSRCINSEQDHLKADNKDKQQSWEYTVLSTQSGNFWISPLIKTLNRKKKCNIDGVTK